MILLVLAAGCVVALSSCATAPPPTRADYRLVWTATRLSDHAPLIKTSMSVAVGRPSSLRTDSARPTEDKPAFTSFTARLSTTKAPDVLQLVTRADLRESIRNKKGKLRVSKRNIGALLPIRPGETQLASLPTDPVQLEVRLERE